MRRPLALSVVSAVLGVVLTVSGCGQDESGDVTEGESTHTDHTSSPEPEDEEDKEPLGEVEFELVEMLTETAAGGKVDPQAIPFGDVVAIQEFSKQFADEAMQARLISLLDRTEIPDGKALYGAVVAVGCEAPPGVVVTSTDSGLTIEAEPKPSPDKQCVAPMTSVALVLVDEAIAG